MSRSGLLSLLVAVALLVMAGAVIAGVVVQSWGGDDGESVVSEAESTRTAVAAGADSARTALAEDRAAGIANDEATVIAEATGVAVDAEATATVRADRTVIAAEMAMATSVARNADDCLSIAAGFAGYPLVAAGREVAGAGLMGCGSSYQDPASDPARFRTIEPSSRFTFEYAGCGPGREAGACVSVSIIVDPACGYRMDRADVVETMTIRGAEVFVVRDGGLRLETPTYNVSITVSGEGSEEEQARAAAVMRALVGVNAAAAALTADAPLTTPLEALEVCE